MNAARLDEWKECQGTNEQALQQATLTGVSGVVQGDELPHMSELTRIEAVRPNLEDVNRAFNDQARIAILIILARGPHMVTEVTAALEIDVSNVSRKLKSMKEAHLTKMTKAKSQHLYSLTPAVSVEFDKENGSSVCIRVECARGEHIEMTRNWEDMIYFDRGSPAER